VKLSHRRILRRGVGSTLALGVMMSATIVLATPESAQSNTTTTTSSTTTTTYPGETTTTTTTVPVTTTTTTIPALSRALTLPWPKQGSAAVAVPALSVEATSPAQRRQAIASLTKMMTTWVVLHQLPLTYAQRGPCLEVTAGEVALYNYDVATDQSSVQVKKGETLCEGTLLRGMLVHSAGNYAALLVTMTGLSQTQFVNAMNRDAKQLGMIHTHYVDFTGISPYDLSTAGDQAMMAVQLISNEPIVQSIVALPKVWLPVAGAVVSYTPLIGEDGVVGVKSGYTNLAGGCDVMTINYTVGDAVVTTFAVVLGQHGYPALGIAGAANLALSRALRASFRRVVTPAGESVEWTGWPGYVVASPTTTTTTTTTTSTTTTSTTTTTTIP
jgi:D-alanyl-D-alanine carboxypeptidase (penicillin-binding protein 5/6)